MPIDKKVVRKALDHFEEDDFVSAKEVLKPEIKKAKEDFLLKKLELKDPITNPPEMKTEGDARGGGIKAGMSGKTTDGKKIKIIKKDGREFLVTIDGEEKKMHPAEMNKISWK
jgi:hypothetical protein